MISGRNFQRSRLGVAFCRRTWVYTRDMHVMEVPIPSNDVDQFYHHGDSLEGTKVSVCAARGWRGKSGWVRTFVFGGLASLSRLSSCPSKSEGRWKDEIHRCLLPHLASLCLSPLTVHFMRAAGEREAPVLRGLSFAVPNTQEACAQRIPSIQAPKRRV